MAAAAPHAAQRVSLRDGSLVLHQGLFAADAAELFAALHGQVDWQQHHVKLFGRAVPAPRLSAWHAEPGCSYRYSGSTHEPRPFTAALLAIRARIEATCAARFNSVLLNLYRDGRDSMSWHSDDEPELGTAPLIASHSLGGTRRLLLRSRRTPRERAAFDLEDGSLLVMEPPLQAHWQHAVPKTRRPCAARINLTWRLVQPCA
jgi:alkylated DNA repair dioxygenase AlkB